MTINPEQTKKAGLTDTLFRGQMAKPKGTTHEQIVEQTQKWVAASFYGTLLKQARDNPFKSELFSGGQGGDAFGSLYDQKMAEHMSRGTGKKLVNAIVQKIEAANAYAKHKNSADAKKIESSEALTAPRTVEASPEANTSSNSRNVRSDVTAVR